MLYVIHMHNVKFLHGDYLIAVLLDVTCLNLVQVIMLILIGTLICIILQLTFSKSTFFKHSIILNGSVTNLIET